MLRLSVLQSWKNAPVSMVGGSWAGRATRSVSIRASDSILMTSAPRLASSSVVRGPAACQQKSITRTPLSGRLIPARGVRGLPRMFELPPSAFGISPRGAGGEGRRLRDVGVDRCGSGDHPSCGQAVVMLRTVYSEQLRQHIRRSPRRMHRRGTSNRFDSPSSRIGRSRKINVHARTVDAQPGMNAPRSWRCGSSTMSRAELTGTARKPRDWPS